MQIISSNPAYLYMEVEIICVALLIVLLLKALSGRDNSRPMIIFRQISLSYIACFVSDALWMLSHSRTWRLSLFSTNIALVAYFVSLVFGSYLWFIYIETVQKSSLIKTQKSRLLLMIPVLIISVLVATSPFTGLVFSIDEYGAYYRGSLYTLLAVTVAVYLAFGSVKAFFKAFSKNNYFQRKKFIMLSVLMLFPGGFTIFQYIVGYDYPVLVIGYTAAVLAVYIEFQESKITVDSLTKINTRDEVLKTLSRKIKNGDKNIYLFMIDADDFKRINDEYGHVEGDNALITIAEALKYGVPKDFIVGRFGGDEFMAVGDVSGDGAASAVCRNVEETLRTITGNKNLPYGVSVSIGFAKYTEDIKNIPSLVKVADDRLYELKKAKKEALKTSSVTEKE